jgi:PII-like signaling protein
MLSGSQLTAAPFGVLQVYVASGDHLKPRGFWQKFFPVPTYLALLRAGRAHGLTQGIVRRCETGFLKDKPIDQYAIEGKNAGLPYCVELHGSREMLAHFCECEREILTGKVVLYREMERWLWQEEARAEEARRKALAFLDQ